MFIFFVETIPPAIVPGRNKVMIHVPSAAANSQVRFQQEHVNIDEGKADTITLLTVF